MEIISSIAELDEKLSLAAAAAKHSPEAFRKSLDGFTLDPRKIVGPQPKDPRSHSYTEWQTGLYELISERSYQTENEKTPFDRDHMMRWPFPYSTRSASLVGDYLMTYGNLIKTMNLAQSARILEVGSGYGPLTYHLASMGHHVTCIDVDESLLEYVQARSINLPGKVVTAVADMNNLQVQGSFDAIIFFESFHHGANHVGLLKNLPKLLEPNGILVLAGEPIVPKGSLAVPYPWGLRLDGLSLWFIRRHGWLELGFEEEYLRTTLESSWVASCLQTKSFVAHNGNLDSAPRSERERVFATLSRRGDCSLGSFRCQAANTRRHAIRKSGEVVLFRRAGIPGLWALHFTQYRVL